MKHKKLIYFCHITYIIENLHNDTSGETPAMKVEKSRGPNKKILMRTPNFSPSITLYPKWTNKNGT